MNILIPFSSTVINSLMKGMHLCKCSQLGIHSTEMEKLSTAETFGFYPKVFNDVLFSIDLMPSEETATQDELLEYYEQAYLNMSAVLTEYDYMLSDDCQINIISSHKALYMPTKGDVKGYNNECTLVYDLCDFSKALEAALNLRDPESKINVVNFTLESNEINDNEINLFTEKMIEMHGSQRKEFDFKEDLPHDYSVDVFLNPISALLSSSEFSIFQPSKMKLEIPMSKSWDGIEADSYVFRLNRHALKGISFSKKEKENGERSLVVKYKRN